MGSGPPLGNLHMRTSLRTTVLSSLSIALGCLGPGLPIAACLMFAACDGSGLGPAEPALTGDTGRLDIAADSGSSSDTIEHADITGHDSADTTPSEEVDLPAAPVVEVTQALEPVTPTTRPLPSGMTEGATLVVERHALEGRFLFGMGSDPDGIVASIGGGAAGLAPMHAVVVLVPADAGLRQDGEAWTAGLGSLEIRSALSNGQPIGGANGLIETYPYSDIDADTIRVDFSTTSTALELAVYGDCRMTRSAYELHAPPVYADGLLTWPADETYTRSGQCQWLPREAKGLHVHYLRHALAGRDFVPRALDAKAPFGFFLAGDAHAPTLTRMPGLSPDEPAVTHTYYLVDFPPAMVPAAEQTFAAWNDALEEIIGRRPFAVALAPAGLIPWDPRFHAVLWSKTGEGGAVAPFTNDPDTGEIFQSFVVMWFGDVSALVTEYKDFYGTHPDLADGLIPTPGAGASASGLPADARFAGFDRHQATTRSGVPEALARGHIERAVRPAELPPRVLSTRPFVRRPLGPHDVQAAVARDYSDEEMTSVIVVDFLLHELGHNLGLRHNFIGSVDKQRHSATHTASTTMDYVIGMLDPGSYDRDAMRYGYGETRAKIENYLYCTDETMDLEPACIQWDFGNPVRYQLELVDAYFAAYPIDTATRDIDHALQWLDPELSRARSFVNSNYERWDETDVATFEELVAMIDCGKECVTHPAMRGALALYMLYSRHQVTAWWEDGYPDIWLDYPALTITQASRLMDTFFGIVTGREEPLSLRTTIVGKLPTSVVSGAVELLTALHEHFANLPALSGDEATVKAAVDQAFAQL